MSFIISASILTKQGGRTLSLFGILKRWLLWLFFAVLSIACQSFHCSSLSPAPCPPGTFFSSEGPQNSPTCHKCPRGFFNHWPGQDACFPCGSEATQPEEGQDTCICRGLGRVFQPSDGQCPCFPGYQDVGEPYGCVPQEYGICKNGATWNQEGKCLTKREWTNHCAQEVCATPRDVRGYDAVLGLCLCWGMDLNGKCGAPCQGRQQHNLQLTCHEGIPWISSIDNDGNQLSYFLDKPLSPRAVGFPCTSEYNQKSSPVYVVSTDDRGFLGLTRPGPELLYSLHQSLGNPRTPAQVPDSSEATSVEKLISLWALNMSSKQPGILNPTVCIRIHDILAFLVTREHYPEYDLGHLYNTPGEYDWGNFRALAEDSWLSQHNSFLFLHQFQQPGVYVFRLSSNRHRKMYIRALPPGGQCFGDGPFVLTTPRYLIQTGIAKTPTFQKKPDWPVVLGLIFLLLGLCLLLLAQSYGLGWTRKSTPCPSFRMHQQKYNMETYSSSRTLLTSVRQGQTGQDSPKLRIPGHQGGCWEAEEQLDLEWFDTNAFFRILQRQSLSVTAKLSQTKEELKLLYLKLLREASSLRELWYMKLRIPAANDPLPGSIQKDQQTAQATAREAEEEARRRQGLADEYAESLKQQLKLLRQDLRARELQWAAFGSALKKVQRLLTAKTELTSEKISQSIQDPEKISPLVDETIGRLSQILLDEGQRLKAWGILGTGTGAELLQPGDASGVPDFTRLKPITRLLVPGPNCSMLPNNGCPGPIPPGYFIHPGTGRLLPEAGNLGYDLLNATLIPTTDVTSGAVRTSKDPIIPYISYPICPATSTPVTTCLPVLQPNKTSQLGGIMTDPETGLEVPVLAVTVHPETGQWLAIGGTYCNPLTKTLAPIEMGGPMEDLITGSISPILGVGLDENTGEVLILGGLRDSSGSLLFPGDSFVEPLSGKSAWLRGACLQEGQIVPHAGGPQALLDANVLAAQMNMKEVLQQINESPRRGYGKMEAAAKDLKQSLSLSLYHLLHQVQRLERQLQVASGIKATGGKMGMIQYPRTEVWIPAVYGMEIPDPAGSGLLVPILGMKCNWNSGQFIPLAGTMEDADGKGLIPISIGAQTIDPMTGEPGPVIGAQIDPSVGVVVPIVQVLGVLPRGIEDSNQAVLLEKELAAREQYWRHQWNDEEQLMEDLEALRQELLDTHNWDTLMEMLPQDRLKVVEQTCCDLESHSLQEAQRRSRVLMSNPLMMGLLTQVDKEEWEQETQVVLGVRKVLQYLGQAVEKLSQEGGRLHGQEKEMWRQQSKYQSKQSWHRTRKVVLHLSGEFQVLVRETQGTLDGAISQLQYIRDLNRLQLLQIQILISRNPVCLENYPGGRFYGEDAASLKEDAIACPLLVPLLRSFTQMLKGAQSHCPVFGDQGQETDLRSVSQKYPYHQASQKSKLIPMQPSELSAREFVIYQHGLSMLQFLTPQIKAPEITLHIASSLPAIHAPGNVFHNSFFYQNNQNKLFILRESLASVGSFSLLLIHCLAHITAADLYQDSNPVFLKLFYEGLKACLSDAFSVKLQMSAIFQNKKSDQCITAILLKGEPTSEERDLLSKLIDTKVKFYKNPESPEECLKKNKYHLLSISLEHFLKNKLSLEQQILTEENSIMGKNKSSETKSLPHFNPQEKKELDSLMQQLTKLLKKEDDF